MSTRMLEVQQKVFQALLTNTNLVSKVTGIFDSVPENTNLPYVTFGKIASQPLNTKTSDGEIISVSMDIWSEKQGKKETVDIMSEIELTLKTELVLDTATLISQRVINREAWEETYGLFTGTIEFEIKTIWEEI